MKRKHNNLINAAGLHTKEAKPKLYIMLMNQGQVFAFESKAEYQEFLQTRDTELCRY